ncbi:hypothetical protein NHJ13734_004571, partial [Beauveria thailandica]
MAPAPTDLAARILHPLMTWIRATPVYILV